MATIIDFTNPADTGQLNFYNGLTTGVGNTANIVNGLTANTLFKQDSVNINVGRSVPPANAKSQQGINTTIVQISFYNWYYLGLWALDNWDSQTAATATFAQQLLPRIFGWRYLAANLFTDSRISNANAFVYPLNVAPDYSFVPNMTGFVGNIFYKNSYTAGSPAGGCVTGVVPPVFSGSAFNLKVNNTDNTVVDTITGTVNTLGVFNAEWTPDAGLTTGVYYVGVDTEKQLFASGYNGILTTAVKVGDIVGTYNYAPVNIVGV